MGTTASPSPQKDKKNAIITLREAVAKKGYQLLATHPGAWNTGVYQWLVYSHGGDSPLLVIQCCYDGSAEVFVPVVDSDELDAIIAAIP